MSTYLQLAQKMKRDCGVAGVTATPTTVVSQTGVLEKLVAWVSEAYKDIQLRYPNWRWMRSNFTLPTVNGTYAYAYGACTDTKTSAAISRFSHWWERDTLDPFRCYLTSGGQSGEYWLTPMTYEQYRSMYRFGVQASTTGQPIHVSVDDDDQLVLGPTPNAVYTVSGSYQRGPQILALDADTPDLPSNYHDLIVYYAMQQYAFNSVAPEKLSQAKINVSRMLRSLERAQLRAIRLGRPLA